MLQIPIICRGFKSARPDHVRLESSSCCCPRASWSFVRPGASWSFDQWHVTRSPPIRKRIWVGSILYLATQLYLLSLIKWILTIKLEILSNVTTLYFTSLSLIVTLNFLLTGLFIKFPFSKETNLFEVKFALTKG